MIFSCGMFFVKKTPKLLGLILTIVNIALIFFVINGTTHISPAYSDLHLIEYKFNSSNQICSLLSDEYSAEHDGKNITDFSMKVGFLGVCVNFGGEENENCGYTSNMKSQYEAEVPSFSVTSTKNSTSNASLELFDIAAIIQNSTIKYKIFIVELVFLLVLFVMQLYNVIGFLPFQNIVLPIIIITEFCFFVILCISITWLMVSIQNIASLGSIMTLEILQFSKGQRVQNLAWVTFSTSLVQGCYYIWIFVNQQGLLFRLNQNTDIEKGPSSLSGSVLSSISTFRGTL